jgi:polysaccharide biosynthesis/export protein
MVRVVLARGAGRRAEQPRFPKQIGRDFLERRPIVGAALMVLAALALSSGAALSQPAPSAPRAYELAPGDKITITVLGQTELSGDYTVDGAGDILLPLAGAVPSTGATLAEVEERIRRRLADGYIQNPKVSIRLSELRPVYILGDVKSAGSYPFRYGMTVLSAIALAGGSASTQQDLIALRGELLQAEERVDVLNAQRFALLARSARLAAQRDSAQQIDFPRELEAVGGDPQGSALLQGEREVFEGERVTEAQEIELLQKQAPHIEAEIVALAEQRRLEKVQYDLVAAHAADLLQLAKNGLTERRRVIEMQREQARIEGNMAKYSADTARANQLLNDIRMKVADVRNGYRQRVMTALQDTNGKLLEVEASIRAAHQAVDIRLQRIGASAEARGRDQGRILLTRAGKGGVETFEADEATPLKPGDILRVGGSVGARIAGSSTNTANPNTAAALGGGVSSPLTGGATLRAETAPASTVRPSPSRSGR